MLRDSPHVSRSKKYFGLIFDVFQPNLCFLKVYFLTMLCFYKVLLNLVQFPMSPTKRKSIPVTTYFGGRLNKRAPPTKMAVEMGQSY